MLKRIILEMGTGNDLHGSDYTKAALRAVQDALHHSSLSVVRSLKLDPNSIQVEVTIGVQQPDKVDAERVRASLPTPMPKRRSKASSRRSSHRGETAQQTCPSGSSRRAFSV